MRILGFSIPWIVLLLVAFIVGAKYPGTLARIPILNRL
jgi:hypothetical protein